MLNGKFYSGLPPKMIDRDRQVPNRMQSHLFWPDETHSVPVTEAKSRRRASIAPVSEAPTSAVETKERFKNEFSKSNFAFNDTKVSPYKQVEASLTPASKRYSSKIEFYDYVDELNNAKAPKTDKNVKREVERNNKNSPKLQDKKLSFDDAGIKIIENKVKNVTIRDPEVKDNRASEREQIYERRRTRTPERMGTVTTRTRQQRSYNDEYDSGDRGGWFADRTHTGHQYSARRQDDYDGDYEYYRSRRSHIYPKSPLPRLRYARQEEEYDVRRRTPSPAEPPPVTERHPKATSPVNSGDSDRERSHQHLRSNINFDRGGATAPTDTVVRRQNIRSSAVMRVSVGLPD